MTACTFEMGFNNDGRAGYYWYLGPGRIASGAHWGCDH